MEVATQGTLHLSFIIYLLSRFICQPNLTQVTGQLTTLKI